MVLPQQISTVIAAGALQTIGMSNTFLATCPRFTAVSAGFYEFKATHLFAEPIQLAAAQYVQYCLLPAHTPALLSTFDSAPSPISSTAALLTLTGAKRAQQGAGIPERASLKLDHPWTQIARASADTPVFGFLGIYIQQNTLFNVYLRVKVRGYNPLY
jgi:hypothetical protein